MGSYSVQAQFFFFVFQSLIIYNCRYNLDDQLFSVWYIVLIMSQFWMLDNYVERTTKFYVGVGLFTLSTSRNESVGDMGFIEGAWSSKLNPNDSCSYSDFISPGSLSVLITTWRHNMAAISKIGNFRIHFALLVICSIILGKFTHNSIR